MLEMCPGTGKTISLLAFVLAYQAKNPLKRKTVVYCARSVPEMMKAIEELKLVVKCREKEYCSSSLELKNRKGVLAVCLSSRRNLCVHSVVKTINDPITVDGKCQNMTASWMRERR